MDMSRQQQLGRWGEQLAGEFLVQHGCEVVERNARTPYGELDLVVRHANDLVFVEVKARSNTAYGMPEQAITPSKREHLVQAAQAYMQAHPELESRWRIDVIAILRHPDGRVEMEWFENALE